MIDIEALRRKEKTLSELVAPMSGDDLRALTDEMIDRMHALIADCDDADVVFVPRDPDANDPYAEDEADQDMAWTLGHVIVHATASSEEAAFLAAMMARGLKPKGRSRYEIPWQSVTTIEQCRHRLEESRRMRLATLDVWPDEPHYEIQLEYPWVPGTVDARGRFVMGLLHDHAHLGQIEEIVHQAHADRVTAD